MTRGLDEVHSPWQTLFFTREFQFDFGRHCLFVDEGRLAQLARASR
jgi:hypothetical protein